MLFFHLKTRLERKIYLRESKHQLFDNNVYEKLPKDVKGHLQELIKTVSSKVRDRKDISYSTTDYFQVNKPELETFNLLPKIHN